jgi:hypothetical protein
MSTVKNADLWTVTFLDANDAPATPDGDVTWEVVRNRRWLDMDGAIQAPGTAATTVANTTEETTGVFLLRFTPIKAGPYSVKASAVVGGVKQAVPATEVEVER